MTENQKYEIMDFLRKKGVDDWAIEVAQEWYDELQAYFDASSEKVEDLELRLEEAIEAKSELHTEIDDLRDEIAELTSRGSVGREEDE